MSINEKPSWVFQVVIDPKFPKTARKGILLEKQPDVSTNVDVFITYDARNPPSPSITELNVKVSIAARNDEQKLIPDNKNRVAVRVLKNTSAPPAKWSNEERFPGNLYWGDAAVANFGFSDKGVHRVYFAAYDPQTGKQVSDFHFAAEVTVT